MFFLKRAWYYVTRKLGKVVTIGIILFIVSTLILTGLVIQSASKSAFNVARNKLGASVTYTTDLSSVMNQGSGNKGTGGGKGFSFEMPDDFTNITTKEVELIANNSQYIKNYVYSASLQGSAASFSYYNPYGDDESSEPSLNANFGGRVVRMNINVSITGVDKASKDVQFDQSTLVDGRYFTDEEIEQASNVIIIEQTIATINELNVGDKITVSKMNTARRTDDDSSSDEIEITYEIVGIYKTANPTEVSENRFGNAMGLSENAMYAPYTTVLASDLAGLEGDDLALKQTSIEENGYQVASVTFNLKNPEDIDAFIEEVEGINGIDLTYRSLNANDAAYEKMVGSIKNVSQTSNVLVIVVVIAGVFIIGLLSMLSIKDRKYELGVLLSLGESKIKIVSQLITEMVMVAVVSFTLAVLTSHFMAQATTNYLLNQEVNSVEETTNNTRPGNIQGGMIGGSGGPSFSFGRPNDLSTVDVDIIDELTVNIDMKDTLNMILIGLLIIIIGNSMQALFVLRANPKEIMLER